jgi:AraC family transcriptional regulator
MEARIEIATEKKLIGKHITMSFLENKTFELWSSFMPRRKEIFDPKQPFEKWAAVEVSDFNEIPAEMESLIIPPELYAVFVHKGDQSDAYKTYHSIFVEWLPNSEYTVDDRPHFAIMGDKYKKNDPDSEEEIWIPIKNKL